jgi:hypothetical protein
MSHSEPAESPPRHPLERWTRHTSEAIRALPALPFFFGIAFGFVACAVAGRIVSGRPMFEHFVRFHAAIQPQRFFYPTASQLVAHVRHHTPAGKIPVIVGGASYFRGTGQNPSEVWTLELQRQLGDRYVVFNFAIDQAPITAFAAVAFEILAREYPEAIYVANGNPKSGAPWDGGDIYGYLFWDAYYKGLLPSSIAESDRIRDFARAERGTRAGLERHLGAWCDQFAYACDLWTYVGYKYLFTVWADEHWRDPHRPRRLQVDGNDPHIRETQLRLRTDANYLNHTLDSSRKASRDLFQLGADGGWRQNIEAWNHLAEEWRNLFPAELRPRCYVVFLRGNPHFQQMLTEEERARTEIQYELGQRNLDGEGYHVVQLRPEDFTADDFLDGGHYVASGGAKIAKAVAEKIVAGREAAPVNDAHRRE